MSELALVEENALSDRNEEQLVTMTVDGQLFGLSILTVQDIVETHNITQVPRTPSAISGIMNLRGRIVTVINLRRILGRTNDSSSRMGVTVEFHGDLYTILVDEIGEVRLLDRSDFEAAPATLDPKLKQLCMGVYRLDGAILAVLDVDQILSGETIAQTPAIQFIARRPKEIKEASQKSLPAPANDDPIEEALEDDEAEASKPKQGKNLFRKLKSSSGAKPEAETSTTAEEIKPEAEREEPAAGAAAKPGTAAKPNATAAAKPLETPATPKTDDGPAAAQAKVGNATDVALGAPASRSQTENLLSLLGGEAGLAKAVARFYENVAGDRDLASHYDGIDLRTQGQAMQTFLCSVLTGAAGGPGVAAPGHQWLSPEKGLGDGGFNKCLHHFEHALQAQSVPDGTIFQMLSTFERYRESVVD